MSPTRTQAGLDVTGLMTNGLTDGDLEKKTHTFVRTRSRSSTGILHLDVCSMGMSGDYELAVECGSTEVRLGSVPFGPRPPG